MHTLWYGVYTIMYMFMHVTYSHFSLIPFVSQIGSGIGRMILKEEMKARSGSYDNDPWGSARNSRSGSKETLNTTSYGTPVYNNTINGCKDPPFSVFGQLFFSGWTVTSPGFLLPFAVWFGMRAVRLQMQMTEGRTCCWQEVSLRWKEVDTVEQLLLNLWQAYSGISCGLSLS